MCLMGRSIAMLLVLALAGGAQACIALCALPAATATSSKHDGACTHCSQTQSEKSQVPATPCKHCQVISQEQWATQADQSANVAFDWTSPLLIAHLAQSINCAEATPASPELPHRPQGERLHQFCQLLI